MNKGKLLPTILVFVVALGFVDASDSYTVEHGANLEITAHTECREVTNDSETEASVYIPTETAAEWESFYGNPPAGISLSSCVTPGSQTFNSSGTFTVPNYNSLTVQVWGGGGGGGGDNDNSSNGGVGGNSSCLGLVARGGKGGIDNGGGGAGGTATGGTSNSTGGSGGAGTSSVGGKGGNAPGGGAGGAAQSTSRRAGNAGTIPGGGGGGAKGALSGSGGGGGGAYSARTYAAGTFTPGSSVSIAIGAAGTAGTGLYRGGAGARGRCTITWN